MTVDMSNNRVPCHLLTEEEKQSLYDWGKGGGEFEHNSLDYIGWQKMKNPSWVNEFVYRTVPQKEIPMTALWEHIPEGYDWIAADENGSVVAYKECLWNPDNSNHSWNTFNEYIELTPFKTLYTRGNIAWDRSLISRPQADQRPNTNKKES